MQSLEEHSDSKPISARESVAVDPRAFGLAKAAYTVSETVELLSIGRTSLYKLIAGGVLKPVRLGKKTLFCASDIAVFLTNLRAAS